MGARKYRAFWRRPPTVHKLTKELHSANCGVTLFLFLPPMLSHRGCSILIKERRMENFRTGLKRRTNQRVLLLSLTAFLVAPGIYLLQPRPITAQYQQVQVVELKAKKYEYVPSPVHVKAGTKVQLKITAVDHDHGFKITTVPNGAESSGKPIDLEHGSGATSELLQGSDALPLRD